MTHEELLANIDNQEFAYDNLARALMAVVELHKPKLLKRFYLGDEMGYKRLYGDEPEYICGLCSTNDADIKYPCPTIQAIEKELG